MDQSRSRLDRGAVRLRLCLAHGIERRVTSKRTPMTIRVAAIEVSHWHALNDAAYLRHLVTMPDVELVAIQDSNPDIVARRAAEVGKPQTFANHRDMLTTARPDFVL